MGEAENVSEALMADLTDAEIAELRRLADAASPAPWVVDKTGSPAAMATINKVDGSLVCAAFAEEPDADFIAAGRNALPRLLDEVESSRALLKLIEWSASNNTCPMCEGYKPVPSDAWGDPERAAAHNKDAGHYRGCRMAALTGGAVRQNG